MGLVLYITKSEYYLEIVLDNKNFCWNWSNLSKNPGITIEDIQNNMHLEWNTFAISEREDLTWDYIKQYIDKPWFFDWYYISKSKCVTWEHIINHIDKPWDWDGISENPNITFDIIKKNINYKWNWTYINMYNKNMSWEIVNNNPNYPWNIEHLLLNSMTYGKERWIHKHRIEIIKARIIQRYWRQCISNPQYNLCKKIILNLIE